MNSESFPLVGRYRLICTVTGYPGLLNCIGKNLLDSLLISEIYGSSSFLYNVKQLSQPNCDISLLYNGEFRE